MAVSRTFPEVHPGDLRGEAVRVRAVRRLPRVWSIATVGFYGKLLAEDIEDTDPGQAEAVKATGAGWFQWLNYSVQPQVMPRMIGLGMSIVSTSISGSQRWSGIVGGGGIGATLN